TKPTFLNTVKYNFTEGLKGKLNYQFGFFGRGYLTLALFILGLVIGRTRFFEKAQSRKTLARLFITFVICVILLTLLVSVFHELKFLYYIIRDSVNILSLLAVMNFNDINTVVLSGPFVKGFAWLYQNRY